VLSPKANVHRKTGWSGSSVIQVVRSGVTDCP